MNVDSAIAFLESKGFEVKKKRKVTYDGSFLGIEMKGTRLDSAASNTIAKDDLEKLRLDALNAQQEMIGRLSPNANKQIDYSSKSIQQLRDIAQANRDAANDRLESYLA
jgi:hypothetical protein